MLAKGALHGSCRMPAGCARLKSEGGIGSMMQPLAMLYNLEHGIERTTGPMNVIHAISVIVRH